MINRINYASAGLEDAGHQTHFVWCVAHAVWFRPLKQFTVFFLNTGIINTCLRLCQFMAKTSVIFTKLAI